jgi:hypothetical protein
MSTFATVIGLATAACTTAANLPQLKKAWTTGETDDLDGFDSFLYRTTKPSLGESDPPWVRSGRKPASPKNKPPSGGFFFCLSCVVAAGSAEFRPRD